MTLRRIDTREQLRDAMGADFVHSAQQWQAITAPLEPGVVIAGAGSGKTSVMAARVVYLVLNGAVRPEQVLGLTFTTKAAGELRQRVLIALRNAGAIDAGSQPSPITTSPDETEPDDGAIEPTVLTYHAYAAGLLSEHGLRIGHEPDTRVLTDAARYQLGARVVERYPGDIAKLTDHPKTAIQNLLALDGAMSEHLVGPDDVRRADAEARAGFVRALEAEIAGANRSTYRVAPEKGIFAVDRRAELLGLVAGYRRLKAELGLMDFGDQIELGARLARDQPAVGAIEREKYRVVLLDEYQDTSVAQALMLASIFSGPDAAHGRGHPVTAVGDPNQAIYGWRGASVSNIVNFSDTFPADPGAIGGQAEVGLYHLNVSRRSDRRIVEAANTLAAPLYERYDQVAALEPAESAGQGTVEVSCHLTAADELDALSARIGALHEAGEVVQAWSDVGVLTRDNARAAEVFDALSLAGIPVEIVGLSGLLRLPEVAEVVATLELIDDVTANPALITLLTGPRWAIGPRDLRLLRERAGRLAGPRPRRGDAGPVADRLVEIADGVDPAEIVALGDALDDLGDLPYSDHARQRFELLSAELRHLRTLVGEPLLDIVRRIIDVTGVDVELASAVSPAASSRRENLDLFVKAVADFQAIDGAVTLAALLAYLTAEDEAGNALDVATPSEADSVKLLTVHRAKGLEWPAVFVVGMVEGRFPVTRARPSWISTPAVLPAPLRGDADDRAVLSGYDRAAKDAYIAAAKAHELEEELRLGYVAVTRPAHLLSLSSYCWSERKTAHGPSPYQQTLLDLVRDWGEEPAVWHEKPDKNEPNPTSAEHTFDVWPPTGPGAEALLRRAAADRVNALMDLSADKLAEGSDPELDLVHAAQVAEWDHEIERLLLEARTSRAGELEVSLRSSVSATGLARLRDDPTGVARDLARPMPRRPAAAARSGTRFHAWVEARFGQLALLDVDDLGGRSDAALDDADAADAADLAELTAAFEAGRFADRMPHRVEPSFSLVLAGQVVRGRIDAVYADAAGWLVVDWKTNRRHDADPLQLAVYRLAWAELLGVDVEQVRAGFYYVRDDELVEPTGLPGRAELEALITDLPAPAPDPAT